MTTTTPTTTPTTSERDAVVFALGILATTAGHSVSLQSTQTGGIRFVDAQPEIRTQGGAITLTASGDIELAGALNAGSGAIALALKATRADLQVSAVDYSTDALAVAQSNAQRLALAVKAATPAKPSLRDRHISPHTIRHTTAMHLLQSGEPIDGIALWLGHESPTTTHQYVEADLAMKEKALAQATKCKVIPKRYRPADRLLAFLESL